MLQEESGTKKGGMSQHFKLCPPSFWMPVMHIQLVES